MPNLDPLLVFYEPASQLLSWPVSFPTPQSKELQGLPHSPLNPRIINDYGNVNAVFHFSVRALNGNAGGRQVCLCPRFTMAEEPVRYIGCPHPGALLICQLPGYVGSNGRPASGLQEGSFLPPGNSRCTNSSGKDHFKSPLKPDL